MLKPNQQEEQKIELLEAARRKAKSTATIWHQKHIRALDVAYAYERKFVRARQEFEALDRQIALIRLKQSQAIKASEATKKRLTKRTKSAIPPEIRRALDKLPADKLKEVLARLEANRATKGDHKDG